MNRYCRGFLLIDIVIAFALSAIFVGILYGYSFSARKIFDTARKTNEALNNFEDQRYLFENMLPEQSLNIQNISANSHMYGNELIETNVEVFSTTTDIIGSLDDALNTTPLVTFSWLKKSKMDSDYFGRLNSHPICKADFGNEHIFGSFEYVTNSRMDNIIENFKISRINLPIAGTFEITDIVVRNDIAIVSIDPTNFSDADVYIFDIASTTRPTLISSMNTGPGISAITLYESKIYASAISTSFQLHILDIDSNFHISTVHKYKIPLPNSSTTPTTSSAIEYYNGYIFLGTNKWDGDELNILDIHSSSTPIKVAGLELGGMISNILVGNNNELFLTGAGSKQFSLADISDINNPVFKSQISPSGYTRQEGTSLNIFEGALLGGRTSGGFNIISDHELFSWASSSSGSLISWQSADIPSGIYGIKEDRKNIYLLTGRPDKEFSIINKNESVDFSTSTINLAAATYFNVGGKVNKLICDADSLYFVSKESPMIYKVNYNEELSHE